MLYKGHKVNMLNKTCYFKSYEITHKEQKEAETKRRTVRVAYTIKTHKLLYRYCLTVIVVFL